MLLAAGAQAQTSWGLKAGVNLGKYSGLNSDLRDLQTMNPSFYVTGFADLPVAPQFSIQPGVSLQGKGSKLNYDIAGFDGTNTINTMSIEIPVNAVYWIPAGSGNVFLGAGPYVGFNVSGKEKNRGTTDFGSGDIETDVNFGNEDGEAKVIDAGANFLAGYKLANGLLINAGYGLGLTSIYNAGSKNSNRVLSFGVGFQF